jgi:hypothetical protein
MENITEPRPSLRATAHCINLQVPEQVHLLCKLLDVELSGVLQRFINDLGHDLYGTNGSSERWQAIDYFMESGYGLHYYNEHDIHQMFYELEQLRNRWAGGDQAAENNYAAYRVRYLMQWYWAWLEKRRPGTMTQALELL